ncbi:MAG: hypothetical protein PVJ39_07480 [Gammaproteobacteria bacterium]|jgi:hypothetical protein
MKDKWDKFKIISGFLGSVVLVAIPVVIKFGADDISRSMERGQLVDSLIEELTDQQAKSRRDIALVALDGAVKPEFKCELLGYWDCRIDEQTPDLVTDIAVILLRDTYAKLQKRHADIEDADVESSVAKHILAKRRPQTWQTILKDIAPAAAELAPTSGVNVEQESADVKDRKSQTLRVIANLTPVQTVTDTTGSTAKTALDGVRFVYIQYQSNKTRVDQLRTYLNGKGVKVPRIEQVDRITQNDIRYANESQKAIAEALQKDLAKNQNIQISKLIDLAQVGYKVPAGQFEVWLKD